MSTKNTEATGADDEPAKEKRAPRKPRVPQKPITVDVTGLCEMFGYGPGPAQATRVVPNYWGVPPFTRDKDDKPKTFLRSDVELIAQAWRANGGKAPTMSAIWTALNKSPVATGSMTTDPLPQGAKSAAPVIVGRNLAAGEEPSYGSPEWALWRDEFRRLAIEAAATASPSDLPFEYQPYSALKAGLSVSPGFEHVSIKEYERNEADLRRQGKLYD